MTSATPGPSGKLEAAPHNRRAARKSLRSLRAPGTNGPLDVPRRRQHVIKYLKFDFRVGGGFTLDIRTPEGDIYIHHSTYIEIKRPEKIAFTWNLEHTDAAGRKAMLHPEDTIVTVELLERGKSTEVVLTHDLGVTSAKERGDYQQGWTGCLEKLAEAVEK